MGLTGREVDLDGDVGSLGQDARLAPGGFGAGRDTHLFDVDRAVTC